MSKGRDRGPRRRGFDDDMYSPRDAGRDVPAFRSPPRFDAAPAGAPAGPSAEATVKWFNPEKGFGFVELADGSGDAFLHIGVLQSAGHEAVAPGAKLKVQIGQGQKGRQVAAVLEVDASTATAPAARPSGGPRGGAPGGRERPDPSTAIPLDGVIKWFNPEKGFGFAVTDDGGKDVFVHIAVLERAGLRELPEGQKVSMRVVQTQKGREAISISLAD